MSTVRRLVGAPTIHPALLVLAKVAVFLPWVLVAAALRGAWTPSTLWPPRPAVAAPLLFLGAAIVLLSLLTLGTSARVGLPREETRLLTRGIYRWSRNPIYAGAYLLSLAAVLYVPHWSTILCGIVAIALHHRIVLAEEAFLDARFGQDWRDYRARVRRYL